MSAQFLGHWISGSQGANRLHELNRRLQDLTVKNLASNSAGDLPYQPWMSNQALTKFFESYAQYQANTCVQTTRIVTNATVLEALDNAFFESEDRPFGKIDPSIKGMRVARTRTFSKHEFETLLNQAFELICRSSFTFQQRLTTLAQQFIPLAPAGERSALREMGSGLSTHLYRGGVFLSLPKPFKYRAIELAINIAHELAHQALIVYQNADELMLTSYNEPVYSPIRKTNRPAILSLHAVVALSFMAEFLAYLKMSDISSGDHEYCVSRLNETIADLDLGLESMKAITFTEFGHALVNEMVELVQWIKSLQN